MDEPWGQYHPVHVGSGTSCTASPAPELEVRSVLMLLFKDWEPCSTFGLASPASSQLSGSDSPSLQPIVSVRGPLRKNKNAHGASLTEALSSSGQT